MYDTVIVGDGPGGLSAALFLAKNGQKVAVLGSDDTPMHKAMLLNYLGIPKITGSEFQKVARQQVADHGAELIDVRAGDVEAIEGGFRVAREGGDAVEGKYLLLAIGDTGKLDALGAAKGGDGSYEVDPFTGRTSVQRLYVLGWAIRGKKIQAVISAGDGAAVALDILSAEAGKDVNDFDVVEK